VLLAKVKFGFVKLFWEFFRRKATKKHLFMCVFACAIFQNKNIVFGPFQPLSMKNMANIYQEKNMHTGSFPG